MTITLLNGDCRKALKALPDNSIDACVTDPPYGLSFMGKAWDYDVPGVETWREVLRVLKPGGHLLSFFGSRTYHRGVLPIEDAGFEIRDQIMWLYGSGFPKSHNLGGAHEGWGTALKPAHEPIVVARKPFAGTTARNVLAHGTGALNIDGCRVGDEIIDNSKADPTRFKKFKEQDGNERKTFTPNGKISTGRWPANVIHDGSDEATAGFPQSKGQQGDVKGNEPSDITNGIYGKYNDRLPSPKRGDEGSAARFFYCAKTSKRDRDEGLDLEPTVTTDGRAVSIDNPYLRGETTRKNNHPTVKPTDLMRYLCRLITPPGGKVLDPFMGSGSTGKAAALEGFSFVGVELDPAYLEIAKARIYHVLGADLV